jgi:hypothetical protein
MLQGATATLRQIYFAHELWYNLLGWLLQNAKNVLILQKKILGIITNTKPRDSCREIFKKLGIMMLYSLSLSLSLYIYIYML